MLLALLACMLVDRARALQCLQYNSNMGATFDLTDLERSGEQPAYSVEDGDLPCTANVEKNYTYVFNICGTVSSGVPPACLSTAGLGTAAALQIDKAVLTDPDDDYCRVAGAYSDKTMSVKLIDDSDPTRGIQLSYLGDYCATPRVQRQFNVLLSCEDKLNPVPLHAYEYEHCVYTVTIPSVYGCPLECPVSQRKLCGGNGHCAYDTDKYAARCFCNKGYSGADCMTSGSSSSSSGSKYSPALLGLIITLFVIIGILVASVVLMIRQVSAYRDDITNYHVLKGGDEGDEATIV